MSQHVLKTTGLSTTGSPNNVSISTPWRLDLSSEGRDDVLVGVSVAVFGFPALVICLICAFRLRVYYVDKRDTKFGFHASVEESSLLAIDDNVSRAGSHVNIKLSTINEALREEEEEEDDASSSTGEFCPTKPTVVTFDTNESSPFRSDPV